MAIAFPDLDPVALQIGPLAIRWYGLAYCAAFITGAYYIRALLKRPDLWANQPIDRMRSNIDDLVVYVMIGVILGGRLGHIVFYDPGYFAANPLEVFAIWKGGMSFHGGVIGTAVAALYFSHKKGIDKWIVGDLICVVAPIGILLVRLANFVNGEIVGSPSSLPWAMQFPGFEEPRHPAMLYEATTEGALLCVVITVLVFRYKTLRRSGLTAGIFLVGYAVARVFCEFFKFADHRMLFEGLPITKGMVLSLPMLAIGIWLIASRLQTSRSQKG